MDIDAIIQAYKAHGWNDEGAIRGDIANGGWKNKEWLACVGGVPIPEFRFDEKAAQDKALIDLAPYYEKLLQAYGGDVALAKQRIDQDYERGLRIKTTTTQWEKEWYGKEKEERSRRFKIALSDLDEQLNSRNLYTSGIRTTEQDRAKADEAYQVGQIDKNIAELDRGLTQYKEEADTAYGREAEDLGYKKPAEKPLGATYAPTQAGIISPGPSYSLSNYKSKPAQKELDLEEQKRKAMSDKVSNAWNRAYSQWMADVQRLATMHPNA